jgi:hypothetical protein
LNPKNSKNKFSWENFKNPKKLLKFKKTKENKFSQENFQTKKPKLSKKKTIRNKVSWQEKRVIKRERNE